MALISLSLETDPALLDRLHALNEAHAVELSSLTQERLRALIGAACLAMADEDGGALLLAFDQDSAYDGWNFGWFKARYDRFVYVDRVVVAGHRRGEGLARQLYDEVIARAGGRPVACEVNYDPPNPASDAFHARLGFVEVGRLHRDGKGVRYLLRTSRHAKPQAWLSRHSSLDPAVVAWRFPGDISCACSASGLYPPSCCSYPPAPPCHRRPRHRNLPLRHRHR